MALTISIVTTTFNCQRTLRDTFDSVLAQKYRYIEYIVVDGGSTDGTLDIIKEYEKRFRGRLRYVSEHDDGLYDAMNKGIRMATGDVVGILNADDLFEDRHVLEDVAEAFLKHRDLDCLYGNLYIVAENDTKNVLRVWRGSQHTKGAFLKGWHPAHPTFYARRELYQLYGTFNTELEISADFELMLRFIEKHEAYNLYIDRFMVKMRVGGASSSMCGIIKGNKNVLRALRINGYKPSPFFLLRRWGPKMWGFLVSKAFG